MSGHRGKILHENGQLQRQGRRDVRGRAAEDAGRQPAACLVIGYEQMAADRDGVINQVLALHGARSDVGVIDDEIGKLTPDEPSEVVDNWQEIEAALRGTQHEKYLG